SGCIAIDWKQELQETAAAQVLFLVDACRQGIRDAMGPPPGWSPSKMRAVAGRKVARLYACAPGELARFVPAEESTAQAGDGGSFSLFSRAVREVLVSHEGPLDLGELRAGVQERVSALHREHRKPGRPQEVRVLTEAVHAEFVVVGALMVPVVPVVAVTETETEPLPVLPAALDPAKLMADALHQVVTTGRTELLEQFAVIGPAADLVKLSGLTALGRAVDAMWTAAARRRPVEPLVELAIALFDADQADIARHLVDLAVIVRPAEDLVALLTAGDPSSELSGLVQATVVRVVGRRQTSETVDLAVRLYGADCRDLVAQLLSVPRPLEDLPALLDALDAAGLHAETDRLVRDHAADGARSVDNLLARLAAGGRGRDCTTVLTAIVTGSLDRLVEWLAIGEVRSGFAEDAALVLRLAVARREDCHLLMAALRAGGEQGHLRALHEIASDLEPTLLQKLLEDLNEAGAGADAEAVIRCAVEPFLPIRAAGLAFPLRQQGPAALLPVVFDALCGASAHQVADFLRAAREIGGDGLVGESVAALAERYPATEFNRLAVQLDDPGVYGMAPDLWRNVLDHRPMTDLLDMLEGTGEEGRLAMLEGMASSDRPAGDLAELVELPGREALREQIGPRVAASLVARGDEVVKGVLVELLARGWESGTRLVIGQVGEAGQARQQAGLAIWLLREGYGERARWLLDQACETRRTSHLGVLAEFLLAGSEPQLGRYVLADAARRWRTRDLVRMARGLAETGVRKGSQATAQGATYLLTRAVRVRTPTWAAELLLALDAEPQGGLLPLDDLLGEFLTADSCAETVSRIRYLRGAKPGSRLAQGVSDLVWTNASALFQAARQARSAEATECLLAACGNGLPGRPPALQDLLAELRMSGCRTEADLVRDVAVRSQPPDAVAAHLVVFQDGPSSDYVAACGAVAGRPVEEVAAVLARLAGTEGAVEGFARWYTQAADQERCRALLCELFARGKDRLVREVLSAAPWSDSPAALAALFLDADRVGPNGGALIGLAAGLDTLKSVDLVVRVVEGGASPGMRAALLRMLALSSKASEVWTRLQTTGRFEDAADLLDLALPDTDVAIWYRGLLAAPVTVDSSAMVEALGADRPIPEIIASSGRTKALLAAVVLFRPPWDVADLLAGLVRLAAPGDQGALPMLWRLLAFARPVPELVLLFQALMKREQAGDALGIAGELLQDESAARAAEVLEATPWTYGPEHVPGAAGMFVQATIDAWDVAELIQALLKAGYRRAAERVVDELTIVASRPTLVAYTIKKLAEKGLGSEFRDRLIEGFCERQPAEAIAHFLHDLGYRQLDADLEKAIAVVAGTRKADLEVVRSVLMQLSWKDGKVLQRFAAATRERDADPRSSSWWSRWKR
ncbi:hypothetical protein VM95_34860, partial [Streptomyces rubellomurinus]